MNKRLCEACEQQLTKLPWAIYLCSFCNADTGSHDIKNAIKPWEKGECGHVHYACNTCLSKLILLHTLTDGCAACAYLEKVRGVCDACQVHSLNIAQTGTAHQCVYESDSDNGSANDDDDEPEIVPDAQVVEDEPLSDSPPDSQETRLGDDTEPECCALRRSGHRKSFAESSALELGEWLTGTNQYDEVAIRGKMLFDYREVMRLKRQNQELKTSTASEVQKRKRVEMHLGTEQKRRRDAEMRIHESTERAQQEMTKTLQFKQNMKSEILEVLNNY